MRLLRAARAVLPVLAVLAVLVLAPASAPAPASASASVSADPAPIRFLQANIGNVNIAPGGCLDQAVKLCLAPVEDRAVRELRLRAPDVVSLQEVLPDEVCAATPVDSPSRQNPFHLCGGSARTGGQIARLLPPGEFDTRCNASPAGASRPIPAWDCLGVRRTRGSVTAYDTRPAVDPATCDNGFTVNIASLRLDGREVKATSAHPQSGQGSSFARQTRCRALQLTDLFGALDGAAPTIVSGDFNLDPYRADDASTRVWEDNVGAGRRFPYRSGEAEDPAVPPFSSNICVVSDVDVTGQVPDPVLLPVAPCAATLDHVATTPDITGPCTTLNGDGPQRRRLDGGGGFDHSAIDCTFAIAAAPAPVVPEVPYALLLPVLGAAAGAFLLARRVRA